MPIQPHIRKGRPADAASLAEFNQRLALETEGLHLLPAVVRAGVEQLLADASLGYYLVAESSASTGQVAEGQATENQATEDQATTTAPELVASLLVTTEWSDWRNGQFWWIQSVYVLPAWRRQGIYRRLYEQVKTLAAQDAKVCGFRLYVEQHNHRAQTTYRQLGMVPTDYKIYEELWPQRG